MERGAGRAGGGAAKNVRTPAHPVMVAEGPLLPQARDKGSGTDRLSVARARARGKSPRTIWLSRSWRGAARHARRGAWRRRRQSRRLRIFRKIAELRDLDGGPCLLELRLDRVRLVLGH